MKFDIEKGREKEDRRRISDFFSPCNARSRYVSGIRRREVDFDWLIYVDPQREALLSYLFSELESVVPSEGKEMSRGVKIHCGDEEVFVPVGDIDRVKTTYIYCGKYENENDGNDLCLYPGSVEVYIPNSDKSFYKIEDPAIFLPLLLELLLEKSWGRTLLCFRVPNED